MTILYHTRNKSQKIKGFTLIELSVVLVIIGLIVGGILMGRELIQASEVRSIITQASNLESQIHTFRSKYSCLPGDCASATTFFGTTDPLGSAIANGDGDGLIRTVIDGNGDTYAYPDCLSGNGNDEPNQLFIHLNMAKLGAYSPFSGANQFLRHAPLLANGARTRIIVSCATYSSDLSAFSQAMAFLGTSNALFFGAGPGSRVIYTLGVPGNGNFVGMDARLTYAIDAKTDDGIANNGGFRSITNYYNNPASCTVAATLYPPASCMIVSGRKLN